MPQRNPKTAKSTPEKEAEKKTESPPKSSRTASARPKKKIEIEVDPETFKGRRTDEEVNQRQDLAYRLRLLGKSTEFIAETLGIAERTVRGYIADAKARLLDELKRLDERAGVAHHFSILNYVLEEALDAWERSKRKKITKGAGVERATKTLDDDGREEPVGPGFRKSKSFQKEEEVIGDPAYLDRALKASREIRELLGLDAPEVKRILHSTDPLFRNLDDEAIRNLSDEELLEKYRAAIKPSPGVE